MPALGVAWHYPRDSPETLVYTPQPGSFEQRAHNDRTAQEEKN